MFRVSEQDIPLCLHCYKLFSDQMNVQWLQNAAMMNRALDDMDLVVGYGLTAGGRVPVTEIARAMAKPSVFNNISVSNSQIGVLNTGQIARIDAAITLTQGTDAQAIGEQLRLFTQTVIGSSELSDEFKSEVVDLLETISEQVVGQRKPATLTALFKGLREKVSGVLALSSAADALWQSVKSTLGF